MVIDETQIRNENVMAVARLMMIAARTAPKGKGTDNLTILTLTGEDLARLAGEMSNYHDRSGFKFFLRDAENVLQSEAVVILGSSIRSMGLNCGYCGFATCPEKDRHPAIPCAFNTDDLGIALGSAAAVAADNRVDNRIMYSVGRSALDLGLLPGCTMAFGIVLSCTGKNPFFDRVANK